MKFTAATASFGMLLCDSQYIGARSYENLISWLDSTTLNDEHGFKVQFKDMVQAA